MEILAEFHPKVVHFPIAFLLLYALLEITGITFNKEFIQKCAHLLLAVGIVTALAAVLTGNQAETAANEIQKTGISIPQNAIEEHEEYATITLWFFTGILVLRTYLVIKKSFKGIIRYVFIPLVLLGSYFIYQTADHGGKLVYQYGVGTDLLKSEEENPVILNGD